MRSSGKGSLADELLSDLLRAIGWASGLMAALATLIALGVAHRIAEPARRLAQATHARGSGDRPGWVR